VDLENVSEVRTGWKSDTFNKIESKVKRKAVLKKLPAVDEEKCFSLVFENNTKTIDLVAPNKQTRDLWVKGIDYLVAQHKNQIRENQYES